MPTTEPLILTTFLLTPAPLPTILPLPKFTALFPASTRNHPQISLLYRDLQHQRTLDIDHVRQNISSECKRGEGMRREVRRRRWREEREGALGLEDVVVQGEEEQEMTHLDRAVVGSNKAHTLGSILRELETACEDLEQELAELDAEEERLMWEMQGTVGGLSDLRYGRFAAPVGEDGVREEVLEGLKGLREVCEKVGGGKKG